MPSTGTSVGCGASAPATTTADDVSAAIVENATGPLRMRGDEGEVEQHKLKDQIAAANYNANSNVLAPTATGKFKLIVYEARSGSTT